MTNEPQNNPTIECAYDELVDPAVLVRHPRNPNTHPPGQVELLGKLILAHGWRAPITVSERSGHVVRGEGRLLAARKFGFPVVPIDRQTYPSEEAEIADLIADNTIQDLSIMDLDLARAIALELSTEGFEPWMLGMNDRALTLAERDIAERDIDLDAADPKKMTSCPNCGFKW